MSNTFSLQSKTYDGRYIKLTCTQTPDIATNTSTIAWTLESIGGSTSYYYTGPTTLTIDGEQVYYLERTGEHKFPCAKGSTSGEVVVHHNNDGSKVVSVSLATAIYTKTVSTSSDTWELNTIPRFATIISATRVFNDEENPAIIYSNPAGESITSIEACISLDGMSDDIAYRNLSPLETSYTFELSDAERNILREATLQGEDTRTVHFILKSYIGDESSESGIISDFRVVNAEPILTVTLEDVDEKTTSLTGGNAYIKGYSDLKIIMSAEAKKAARIESYTATLDGETQFGQEIVFDDILSGDLFVECKDNRGLVDNHNKQADVQLIDYFKPTISAKGNIEMDGEVTSKVSITISGTFFNDGFGAVDNDIEVFINHTGSDDWESLTDNLSIIGNDYFVEFNIDNLDYLKSFVYQVKVVDKLDSAETSSYTLKMTPVFDWGENDFNFNVPIHINRIPLFDLIYPVGSIYMSTNLIDPTTIFGGKWERIQDRFLLAASDTYDAGTTGGASTTALTVENLPSHSHEATSEYTGGSLLIRGPSDANHNIVDDSLGNGNITKTAYEGDAWGNSISTSSTDRAPEQINIGGTVTTTIESTGDGKPIDILPPYLTVYMWTRTA